MDNYRKARRVRPKSIQRFLTLAHGDLSKSSASIQLTSLLLGSLSCIPVGHSYSLSTISILHSAWNDLVNYDLHIRRPLDFPAHSASFVPRDPRLNNNRRSGSSTSTTASHPCDPPSEEPLETPPNVETTPPNDDSETAMEALISSP